MPSGDGCRTLSNQSDSGLNGLYSLIGPPSPVERNNVMRVPAAICLGLALLLGGCGDSDDDDDDDRRGGVSQQEDDDDD